MPPIFLFREVVLTRHYYLTHICQRNKFQCPPRPPTNFTDIIILIMLNNFDIKNYKRILIIGDSGRGKSTFAAKLANKLSLPLYSTDDYFWKVKFSVPNDRRKSIEDIEKIYSSDAWIVEGGTVHLIKPGLERADIILNFVFRNIFEQWYSLVKRNRKRNNEAVLPHLIYVTKKRFGIGNDKEKKKRELLKPFKAKIMKLKSYQEMDRLLVR